MTKTAEEVREDLERRRKKRGRGKRAWVKIGEGQTYVRIGPPWKKEGEVWKDVYYHGHYPKKVYCASNDVDDETGKKRKCIVCKRLASLKGDKSKKAKKLWGLITQKNEGLWNVLIAKVRKRDDGSMKVKSYEDEKFKILRLSSKWHNMLLDIFSDEDYRRKSILGVTHSKFGRLIKVKREGTGRDDTNYSFHATDKESAILPEKEERLKILKTLNDLDEIVNGSSDEELETFLRRMEKKAKIQAREEDSEDEDEDDEDEDADTDEDEDRSKKKSKKKDRDEDEDEDEEEKDEDSKSDSDDDDLEKKYNKMKKKLKDKKKEGEDEDEEEDDKDEEEDEDEDDEKGSSDSDSDE